MASGIKKKRLELIQQAIDILGSQEKLAQATGWSQYAIWKAVNRGECSPGLATAIELATGGQIKRQDITSHPEVFIGLRPICDDPPPAARAS